MPVTLATLPEDVLLYILELGNVDAVEALSLRWTCKSLFRLSEQAPYWTIVGKTVRRHDPLPLPPFRTLEELNPSEARETIVRHVKTKRNLESQEPRFKRHRVISLPQESSRLSNFWLLPGGRWMVTAQRAGRITVFDFSTTVAPPNNVQSEVMNPSLPLPEHVGRIVGSYNVGFEPMFADLQMGDDDGGRHLNVAVSSLKTIFGRPVQVLVIRFDLGDDNEALAPPRLLYRAALPFDVSFPLVLGGNLMVALVPGNVDTVIAMNWSENRVVQLDSSGHPNEAHKLDGLDFLIQDDNILLYRHNQNNQLEFYTYFDISSRMRPLSTLMLGETKNRIPPDSWATVDLALPALVSINRWFSNTTSAPTLPHAPIIGRAPHRIETDSGPVECSITFILWLELRGMLASLREGRFQRGEEAPTLKQFFEGPEYYSDGWVMCEVGTCGRHVLRIHQGTTVQSEETAGEDGSAVQLRIMPGVEMIKLPFVGEGFDEEITSQSLRRLQVPLGISQRTLWARFCDEWGILGIVGK
ncbi:hypothetical protein FS837_001052, partial [Tulasnella sp. UAMH 9824]